MVSVVMYMFVYVASGLEIWRARVPEGARNDTFWLSGTHS